MTKSGRQLPRRPGMGSDATSYTSRGMTGNDDSDDSDYNANHYPTASSTNAGAGGTGPMGAYSSGYSSGRVVADSDDEEETRTAADYEATTTTATFSVNGEDNENNSASLGPHRSGHRGHRATRESREADAEAAAAAQAAAQLQAQQNEALREMEEHRKRIQLYVLVCRCVAYPFIAKQPTDMVRRQPKITKQQLQQIKVVPH